jgi:solute carrier family 35, member E1
MSGLDQPWLPNRHAHQHQNLAAWPADRTRDFDANPQWAHKTPVSPINPFSMHGSWTERWKHTARRWLRRYAPRAEPRQSITTSTSETFSTLTTLPSPATLRFVFLCALWYTTSALSSNTGKVILNQFRYPVTLTIVQFAFVAGYCLIAMSPAVRFSRLRSPTRAIVRTTLPMGMFQVGGHMFSSMAISRIPVSTVHTIKVRRLLLFLLAHPKI